MELETIIRQALCDKYEILSIIGKGGMATVYKAIQINLNRPVALKIVHQNLVHDEEFIKRFIREAQVCASLNHSNIVTVHDIGSIGTVHYMAMEYLEGMTLRDMVQSHGSLGVEETVDIIAPIAQALGFIHQRGLIHRDVKSSNVFVTNDGRPVLMDFGIVYSEGRESLSQSGTVLGTPEYMSPEQAEGKVLADGRSDLYSLGVIMFECLTGQLPFYSDNYLATLHQVLHDSPPLVKSLNPKVPEWINNIVAACLVKDRIVRISDGMALAKALKTKENPTIIGSSTLNDKLTRKIIAYEHEKARTPDNREEKNQPLVTNKVRKSLLVGIFYTLVVILITLGVSLLSPGKLQSSFNKGILTNAVAIFEEKDNAPKVTTIIPLEAINLTSATVGGSISIDVGNEVISRGVCWSTSLVPKVVGSHTNEGTGIGHFTSIITGLKPNTSYFVRAYATTNFGTYYGEETSFTTLSNLTKTNQDIKNGKSKENILKNNPGENYPDNNARTVTDIEGNIYKTITIGSQVWMAENLRTTRYKEGTSIPLVTNDIEWSNLKTPGYCWYNNDLSSYKTKYGALYNGYSVITDKLCPIGWHVPSDAEWNKLETYLGGEPVAGGKLKAIGTTYWSSPNIRATDKIKFTAIPGGNRDAISGKFSNIWINGFWWTSTVYQTTDLWYRCLYNDEESVYRSVYNKKTGFSVRCIKN